MTRLDRELAEQALDRLLVSFTFETVASEVLLPYLADVGARWQRGDATVAEEHLATHVLRARLLYWPSLTGSGLLVAPARCWRARPGSSMTLHD